MTHPTIAEINLGAIRRNVRNICKAVAPAEVLAVVKADGYGHGAIAVALAALSAGATRLGVAYPAEGAVLRDAGISAPVQVFGGFFPEQISALVENHLEFTVCDFGQAQAVAKYSSQIGKQIPVHIKFDTGMGRVGFAWEQAPAVFAKLREISGLEFRGLMTHLATADERDKSFANEQIERFNAVIDAAKRLGLAFRYRHAANSGAILDLPAAHYDLVRAGVMMYGHYPSSETTESIHLEPAMRWRSRLLQVKTVPVGQTVSYGATWCAHRETVIGTVAVGYADGYDRNLSGKMQVVVNGRRVPVVGRVCMDMIMVDLGPNAEDRAGDEVVLLGRQGHAEIAMREFCDALDTIPYEVTCKVSQRVPRLYVDDTRLNPTEP